MIAPICVSKKVMLLAVCLCTAALQCTFWYVYSSCGMSFSDVWNCITGQNLVSCCQNLLKSCFWTWQLEMVTWAFQVSTTICHIWLANLLLWNLLLSCQKAVQAVSVLVSGLQFIFSLFPFSLFCCIFYCSCFWCLVYTVDMKLCVVFFSVVIIVRTRKPS